MRARQRYRKRRKSAVALVLALKAAVEAGTAKLRRRYPDGRSSRWEAYVHGRRVRFVFDHTSGMVVTVLPPRGMRRRDGYELPVREGPEAAQGDGDAGLEPV
jgi:hypothetical protein